VDAHYVVALNVIKFEWMTGQSPRGQFDFRFAELEEFKNNHGTTSFLGEYKKNHPKLATWTSYAKSTTIKVLNKEDMNSVFTLVRIKKLVDIGLVPQSIYMYEPGEQEEEDADELLLSGVMVLSKKSNKKAMMVMILRKSNNQLMKIHNKLMKSNSTEMGRKKRW
jgi:hypothetical protein